MFLSACAPEAPTSLPPSPVMATPAPQVALATPSPQYPWTDESAVMHGICFEAALDAAGELFVLRTADEHIRFFDLADESDLCRRPVARNPFDFSNGRILAGLWSAGIGCGLRHEVIGYERDDAARVFRVALRVVIDGGCNYELVRPYWIGLDGMAGYDVRVVMSDG